MIPYNLDQKQLLQQEIRSLLQKGAIEVVSQQQQLTTPGFYSPLFPTFATEVTRTIKPNNWMTSIDLSDAFLHIPVHPSSRRFLRFRWNHTTYQFKTTPFGLSLVPWLFTKITKPILEWARQQNIRLSAYLDDWILVADTFQQAHQQTQYVLHKLKLLGWIVNEKKSTLLPTQQLDHLGFSLNTTNMTAQLPGNKIRNLRKSIQQILKDPLQSARTIHSFTMRIQSATFALLPARLYTQHLLRMKNQSVRSLADWDKKQPLPVECLKELRWWQRNLQLWNGKSILPQTPQQTIYVDASNTGWGCSLNLPNQPPLTAHGHWTHQEARMSINWRELKAAFLALRSFPRLQHMRVMIRTDNTTSMAYMNKHGRKRSLPLMELATKLWKWCLKRGITIQSTHVQGIANKIADFESRRPYQKNNWMLRRPIFHQLQQHWGTNDVDLFADRNTHQVKTTCLGSQTRADLPPTHSQFLGINSASRTSTHRVS
ncbi:hypothetical protein INT47_001832 [Mucor saturninus]|uniref:Reverse transcriptase domain-containing protein n=1 Tax=Mucor saturninus TaxID=64648 RepID=A0A8H7QEP5_9FUNG|nr:hypothetical protein INT47_001832 [Mucor saturninus]